MRGNVWIVRGLLIFSQLAALIIVVILGQTEPQENLAVTSMPVIPNNIQSPIIPPQKNPKTTPSLQINKVEFVANYQPRYEVSWAHPNNYGQRYLQDINGRPVNNQPIIVIHETVNSATSAINNFQTPHTNENAQVSYHALIKLDGTVIYIVPPRVSCFWCWKFYI
jgi:hypothetical protein